MSKDYFEDSPFGNKAKKKDMSNNVRTLPDYFSDPADKSKINAQFLQIEFMRDFIVWLCEEECNSTVYEMEEQFKDYVAKLEGE